MKIEWKEEYGKIFLFCDGERVRTLSPRIVSTRDLSGISAPTWDAFEHCLSPLEQKGGMQLALASLSRRSYHSQKLRTLLKKHFLPEHSIESIISFCQEKGYLNDQSWEEQRIAFLRTKGKSAKDIAFRLKNEGIRCSFDKDDQGTLEKLIVKKYPALLQKDLPLKEKAKSIQALLRRGFSLQDIQKFLSDVYTQIV